MTPKMGFLQLEEEKPKLNKLEEQMGVKFIEKDKEPFPGEIGKYKIIHLTNATLYGCYRGINERDRGILLPHIVFELATPLRDERNKRDYVTYWEIKELKYFPAVDLNGMDPLREEFAKRIVPGEEIPKIEQLD